LRQTIAQECCFCRGKEMLWKSRSFSSLQEKQICLGRQQWNVMINAERKVETAGLDQSQCVSARR